MEEMRNFVTDKKNNKKERIGILGGTFDPIHNGHLRIAHAAREEFHLTKVLLIPTGISYMKKDVTDSYFRYKMVKLAAAQYDAFEASDVEIKREGNTYTCDTIAYFKEKYPDAELFFIIGTDSLFSLEKWKNISFIFDNCTILCASRPGEYQDLDVSSSEHNYAQNLCKKYNAKVHFIHSEPLDISSTEIREYRKNNPYVDLSELELPGVVADYILVQGLYYEKIEEIHCLLKEDLTHKRWKHTIGVVDTAVKLARKWGCDVEKARFAALLHDCAKYLETEAKCALCVKYGVVVTDIELSNPELLHAKAGALLAYEKYGISDQDILSAIFYHTTGKEDMNLLEQIVFVADYIEPGRTHSDKLSEYRSLAYDNLNKVTADILKDTVKYLKKQSEKKLVIDPQTNKAYDFYKKYL